MSTKIKSKKRKPSWMSKPVFSLWWWLAIFTLDIVTDFGARDYPFDLTVLVLILIVLLIKSDREYEKSI